MPLAGSISTADALRFHAHPDVWLLMGLIAAGYLTGCSYFAKKEDASSPAIVSVKQRLFFFSGLVILWIGADWPIHDISEGYLFSVHMLQHTLFSLIAPPLLLLGLPPSLLRGLLKPVMPLMRIVTRPLFGLLAFNAFIVITHWPPVIDLALRSEPAHFLLHLGLVTVSLLMWWPVISPLPELNRLSEPGKMLYLLLQSVVPTVPASFITFASRPIYTFYTHVPRLWGLDVVTDQRIAGLLMKLGGGLILWTSIAILFFRWSAREQAEQVPEIAWEDFEHELEVWDLRK